MVVRGVRVGVFVRRRSAVFSHSRKRGEVAELLRPWHAQLNPDQPFFPLAQRHATLLA